MSSTLHAIAVVALLLTGAIFGFFYAWICSTMWGLDAAPPDVAIRAMQEMNASVRNPVFFASFFLTPVALALAALAAWRGGAGAAALAFAAAGLVYLLGAVVPTTFVNVPMNEALAEVRIPEDREAAARIWQDFSGRWQAWNTARTVASGVALALVGAGLLLLPRLAPAPMQA